MLLVFFSFSLFFLSKTSSSLIWPRFVPSHPFFPSPRLPSLSLSLVLSFIFSRRFRGLFVNSNLRPPSFFLLRLASQRVSSSLRLRCFLIPPPRWYGFFSPGSRDLFACQPAKYVRESLNRPLYWALLVLALLSLFRRFLLFTSFRSRRLIAFFPFSPRPELNEMNEMNSPPPPRVV